MLLSRFGGFLLLAICIAHFTGATGVSRPENVDRADPIGVLLQTACNAAAQLSALRTTGSQFELEGLQAFHQPMIRLVYER